MRVTEIDTSLYHTLLEEKVRGVVSTFAEFNIPEVEVFESTPEHFRMRAEFRVWHDGDDLYHIMFDKENKEKYRVDKMPAASTLINDVMRDLLSYLKPSSILRSKLFQIDYLSTLSGEIVVSLLYHRQLDETWEQAVQELLKQLRTQYTINIIGRARKQKLVFDEEFVTEQLTIKDKVFAFRHIENSFTQPNALVNQKMIEWSIDKTGKCSHDLLELYCGLGNFTLPLAQNFNRVLATEISKSSVQAAHHNLEINGIKNVNVIRMSSEEFTEAMSGKRTFQRLQGLDLKQFDCKTVLVDPPRSGVDDDTINLINQYDNIVYISCNPETLFDNLKTLTLTHQIANFAVFDQFPYTDHLECGVYLKKL